MWILLGVLLEVAHAVKAPAYASMMAIEDYLFYEMDGEVAEWQDDGDCTLMCG